MLLVVENKTTSADISAGSDYWRRLILDPQVSIYIIGARQLGLDVGGVLFNVLRRPALEPLMATPPEKRQYTKPTKKDPVSRLYANQRDRDETPEEFERRCLDAMAAEPAKYFQRQTIVRLGAELDEARLDTWHTAGAIREAKRLTVWPRNPDSCLHWGKACDYFSACSGEQSIDDPLLFEVRPRRHEELDEANDDVLTQSAIRCYRACPRKYFLRYERKIRRLALVAEPLRLGKSIHRGLEAWWKGATLDQSIDKLDKHLSYVHAKERAMMIGHHVQWSEQKWNVISVEKEWQTALINPDTGRPSQTFRLGGRCDVVVADV